MEGGTFIHPMAVVEEGARLGAGVHVGPFCHVGPDVVLGDGVRLVSHATILGATTLGEGCTVYPTAVLGAPPQDLKHGGGRTTVTIGRHCTIREAVTVHAGSDATSGATIIGDKCYLMANTHVAHDCRVGNNVVMANYSGLAGHAEVGDGVIISAFGGVHQFARIGHNAFIGGSSSVFGDLIPYGMAAGNPASLRGFNLVGLRRAGMSSADLARMRRAYRQLFSPDRPLAENVEAVGREYADFEPIVKIVKFLSMRGKRHFVVPSRKDRQSDEDDAQE